MTETIPEVIKIKNATRANSFGIAAFDKAITTIVCALTPRGYKTGLTKEEEEHYEKAIGLKPGELSRHSIWWGDVFNTIHTIRLKRSKTNELVLDNPINQLRYKVLLASSKIANSEIEKNPDSEFFIDNQELRAQAENEAFNYEFEAMGMIHKLTPEEKRGSLRLFGKKGIDDMKELMLNAELVKELKKDPKKFVETMNDKDLKTKVFIAELIERRLISRKGNNYVQGDDVIASGSDECVNYFNDIKNQSKRLILQNALDKAKQGK